VIGLVRDEEAMTIC